MRSGYGNILIIGGGIGGTSAAIALRNSGFDATVYEARSLRGTQYGGCYVLWYAGVMSLARLGLLDKAIALGHRVDRFEMCGEHDNVHYRVDMAARIAAKDVTPLAIRRADLLNLLYGDLGTDALHLNSTLQSISQDGHGVTATFTDGRTARGTVLVGADGLQSRVRAHMHGMTPARHPGYAHWSGISESDGGAPVGAFRILHGRSARFAFFHLGDGRVCWWAVRKGPEGPDSNHLGAHRALTMFFRDWSPIAGRLLEATKPESFHRRDTFDRSPLLRWGKGRVTLLGDAAHAMTFDLGQGAGTSLTDAVVFADQWARHGAPIAALRGYERARRKVTLPLVMASREIGAATNWGGPLGPKANGLILRTLGAMITPSLLALDARSHAALLPLTTEEKETIDVG
ncbi:NAD(P)/FAD-dependent oxidoreductase [Nocardia sp. NPDC046763]|uniref:FAD-dependent oxidoreductase n=1 Tax=Nocardia sp. NPDC046763 TaxID=3155256 RepID=UPI0033C161A7